MAGGSRRGHQPVCRPGAAPPRSGRADCNRCRLACAWPATLFSRGRTLPTRNWQWPSARPTLTPSTCKRYAIRSTPLTGQPNSSAPSGLRPLVRPGARHGKRSVRSCPCPSRSGITGRRGTATATSKGANHIVVRTSLRAGRLNREEEQPLCWTPSRAHELRYVEPTAQDERNMPDCKACLRNAEKLAGRPAT